ncbi:MAG: T9SS type A sorting domain-containing protein [Bacteroidetes bacterium]|nr:T9SS type A sorting domain-containing protein [Bacteroidota bacterium]
MKKIFTLASALLIAVVTFAQGDTTGRSDLAFLFQPLNANNIPTGYLMEWGTDMTDKDDLNGQITDSNFVNNMDLLRMVYADLYSAKYKTTAPTLPSVDALNSAIAGANANSLVIVYGQYATFDPNALQTGKLNYTNGRIYETGTGSPYLQKQVFAAYPKQSVFTNTVTLRYNTALYYNNSGVTVSNVQINWGAGFVNAPSNTDISYTYTDTTGPKIVKIKVQLSNGQILQTQMVIKVVVTNPGGFSPRYTYANLATPDIVIPAQSGVHSGCKIYIRRSVNTPAGQLIKPLIVVEGLDIHSALPEIAENYDVNKYIYEVSNINGYDLSNQLDNLAGYDLVFIDWGNGVGDIPGNAKCLEQALDALETIKTGSSEDNVIIGISMGGLISRYCLADMVKRIPRKATHTRLLVTMDSPHQGAYIPLSFQHLTMALPEARGPLNLRLGSIFNSLDRVKNNLLLSPGAQQQLNFLVTNTTGTVTANTFLLNTYRPKITFPNPAIQPEYDFKAISNGSQCGLNVMQPGDNLVTANAGVNGSGAAIGLQLLTSWLTTGVPFVVVTKLKYKIDLNAKALTGNSSHEILYFKFKRESKLFFVINNNKTFVELHRNEPTFNSIPWESVPGGTQSLGDRMNVNSAGLSGNWSFIAPWFLGFNYNVTMAPVWSFVPVTSALDIQNPSSQNGQYVFPINGQNGSTATGYIAQETTTGFSNVNHTNFTARNAKWLYEELENVTHPLNDCRDICTETVVISGPASACSGSYSVPLMAGVTYNWQVSPSGSISLEDPNNPNILNIGTFRNAYGVYTISVSVINSNGCILATGTKIVELGLMAPYPSGPYDPITHDQLIVGYPNINYYFTAYESSPNYGPFTYTWTLTPPSGPASIYLGPTPTINFPTVGYYSLSLKKQSATCGNVTVTRTVVIQPNYGGLIVQVTPNPSTGLVVISYDDNDGTGDNTESKGQILNSESMITVYNMQGIRMLQEKTANDKSIRLNVSNLPNGLYIVELISKSGKRGIQRLIIQR